MKQQQPEASAGAGSGDGGHSVTGTRAASVQGAPAGLGRLEAALRETAQRGPAPVEKWNPPYCGDIGMAILRDGTWSYRGSPILRPALVRVFASVLRRDEDGRHYLVTPVEKVDVAVADAPFLAVELEVIGAGEGQMLVVRTNLDEVVRIGGAHPLRFEIEPDTGGLKPYVRVRGRLEALATRAATYDIAELSAEGADGAAGVWSDGVFFPFPG